MTTSKMDGQSFEAGVHFGMQRAMDPTQFPALDTRSWGRMWNPLNEAWGRDSWPPS
jgi:hypothetical protein